MNIYRNRIIVGVAAICFAFGLALSHRIEPGVSVQKVTLVGNTPALKFIPTGAGPHPVALLAHGYAGAKENLFRYAEALAAAGFICYSVDQPGHGESSRKMAFLDATHTLEAVAREIEPVDVFVGQSMGGATGGEAVLEDGMKPGLFIAVGYLPVLGDQAPPLLLLIGQFEEGFPPAFIKARTDAPLVISPWSDHMLEGFDPLLVNAAVAAACATVHKTPPPPPTAWGWRLMGVLLAMLAAGTLANYLTDLFPPLARCRGLLLGGFIVAAFMLTMCGRWIDVTPHLRLQGIAVPVTFLLAIIASRLRLPRWSFAVLGVLLMVIALCWLKANPTWVAFVCFVCTLLGAPALIAGVIIGWVATRHGSRLQGDIALAIFVGCAPFQCVEPPQMVPQPLTPHHAIKLDAKLLDVYIGQYESAPGNLTPPQATISHHGDHLVWHASGRTAFHLTSDLYPESETNFFLTKYGVQVTFIKNDQGEVTTITYHEPGLPDRAGKKLKNK